MLHKEAARHHLQTCSVGVGAERAIRVLPPGERAPVPSALARRVASLALRLSRLAFQNAVEGAREAPFSQGELEEIYEACYEAASSGAAAAPADISAFLACAHSALARPSLPTAREGELALAGHTRWAYSRVLVVQGRETEATHAPTGPKGKGGAGKNKGDLHRKPRPAHESRAKHPGKSTA